MEMELTLSCDELSDERLQEMTMELMNDLNRETDCTAKLPEPKKRPGGRGDVVTFGQILLAFLASGGAAVKLIGVLNAYVQKQRTVKMSFKRPDGATLVIDAKDMKPNQYAQTLEAAKLFFGEGK